MNITEKILAKSANKTEVQPDETINANIDTTIMLVTIILITINIST